MTETLVEAVARAIGRARIGLRGEGATLTVSDTVYARAALTAIEESGTHVVAPAMPDKNMISNGAVGPFAADGRTQYAIATDTYIVMLAARPKVT